MPERMTVWFILERGTLSDRDTLKYLGRKNSSVGFASESAVVQATYAEGAKAARAEMG